VMMPGMDGWKVLSELKADPSVANIPVVMLTMMDDRKRGYDMGASNYLTKPTDHRRLAGILKKYTSAQDPCPVLLVDDDPVARKAMRSMLTKSGCSVTEAENGRVALDRIAENRPSLVFLDLVMPEMDGFEFAASMHRHLEWRSIPIVVLTAADLTVDELRRLNGNIHTILDKGESSREELMLQVRDLIAGWSKPTGASAGESALQMGGVAKVTNNA
jgi:CheY-like chemotaxis protein